MHIYEHYIKKEMTQHINIYTPKKKNYRDITLVIGIVLSLILSAAL